MEIYHNELSKIKDKKILKRAKEKKHVIYKRNFIKISPSANFSAETVKTGTVGRDIKCAERKKLSIKNTLFGKVDLQK